MFLKCAKTKLILVISMGIKVKARYENEVLKPFGKLELEEGEEVEIEVPISMVERTYAVSKLSDDIIEEIIETTKSGE
jgi:predicted DNA-binding antitoxin AbrB/MazE fold protein